MGKSTQEKLAFAVSIGVLVVAAVFWVYQIGDVIDVLRMAYG